MKAKQSERIIPLPRMSWVGRNLRRSVLFQSFAVSVLFWELACLAQSNDVFSVVTTPSTPLTGYRVAAVSITPIWVIGSPPKLFGIEECSYWTDSAGQTILWPANRVKQAGDIHHR